MASTVNDTIGRSGRVVVKPPFRPSKQILERIDTDSLQRRLSDYNQQLQACAKHDLDRQIELESINKKIQKVLNERERQTKRERDTHFLQQDIQRRVSGYPSQVKMTSSAQPDSSISHLITTPTKFAGPNKMSAEALEKEKAKQEKRHAFTKQREAARQQELLMLRKLEAERNALKRRYEQVKQRCDDMKQHFKRNEDEIRQDVQHIQRERDDYRDIAEETQRSRTLLLETISILQQQLSERRMATRALPDQSSAAQLSLEVRTRNSR